jgi:hypothetical protein
MLIGFLIFFGVWSLAITGVCAYVLIDHFKSQRARIAALERGEPVRNTASFPVPVGSPERSEEDFNRMAAEADAQLRPVAQAGSKPDDTAFDTPFDRLDRRFARAMKTEDISKFRARIQ